MHISFYLLLQCFLFSLYLVYFVYFLLNFPTIYDDVVDDSCRRQSISWTHGFTWRRRKSPCTLLGLSSELPLSNGYQVYVSQASYSSIKHTHTHTYVQVEYHFVVSLYVVVSAYMSFNYSYVYTHEGFLSLEELSWICMFCMYKLQRGVATTRSNM